MNTGRGRVVPLRIDLSALVQRSVATLYSHLVTRPTGQALRLGIEGQICELGPFCLSILDFTQVVVLDYSCADEVVAKLLQRFRRDDRPADAYFIARGIGETHRETIETVLARHGLALVAELDHGERRLLGEVSPLEQAAWSALETLARADVPAVAERVGASHDEVGHALQRLMDRRVILRHETRQAYVALSALVRGDG